MTEKQPYTSPKLETFGKVEDLTLNGCTHSGSDGNFCPTTPGRPEGGYEGSP
jgi:hypothetical protein